MLKDSLTICCLGYPCNFGMHTLSLSNR